MYCNFKLQLVSALCLLASCQFCISQAGDFDSFEDDDDDFDIGGPSKKNKYSFSYGVNEPENHDVKSHTETRDGDTVKGKYSVLESDGSIRTVEYAANKETGFHAVVKTSGKVKSDSSKYKNSRFRIPSFSSKSPKPKPTKYTPIIHVNPHFKLPPTLLHSTPDFKNPMSKFYSKIRNTPLTGSFSLKSPFYASNDFKNPSIKFNNNFNSHSFASALPSRFKIPKLKDTKLSSSFEDISSETEDDIPVKAGYDEIIKVQQQAFKEFEKYKPPKIPKYQSLSSSDVPKKIKASLDIEIPTMKNIKSYKIPTINSGTMYKFKNPPHFIPSFKFPKSSPKTKSRPSHKKKKIPIKNTLFNLDSSSEFEDASSDKFHSHSSIDFKTHYTPEQGGSDEDGSFDVEDSEDRGKYKSSFKVPTHAPAKSHSHSNVQTTHELTDFNIDDHSKPIFPSHATPQVTHQSIHDLEQFQHFSPTSSTTASKYPTHNFQYPTNDNYQNTRIPTYQNAGQQASPNFQLQGIPNFALPNVTFNFPLPPNLQVSNLPPQYTQNSQLYQQAGVPAAPNYQFPQNQYSPATPNTHNFQSLIPQNFITANFPTQNPQQAQNYPAPNFPTQVPFDLQNYEQPKLQSISNLLASNSHDTSIANANFGVQKRRRSKGKKQETVHPVDPPPVHEEIIEEPPPNIFNKNPNFPPQFTFDQNGNLKQQY